MSKWKRDPEWELEKELKFHVEERVADLVKSGLSEEEARRMVRQEFGGLDQVREQCRDVRPGRWLGRLFADVKHSLRAMRKSPALSLTIIATVAVCAAVNTAVFTVVDSLLIRPLPFPRADRLIVMTNLYPKAGMVDRDNSAPGDYVDREGAISAVADHALYQFVSYPIDQGTKVVQARGMVGTPSLFEVLDAHPSKGRLFDRSEGEPGKDDSIIITDGLWRELFGGGDVIGQRMRINGKQHMIAGILPAGFRFIAPDVRFFVPLALNEQDRRRRHANLYRYVARLKDGATVDQAREQVRVLNARLLDEAPEMKRMIADSGFHTHVEAFQPWLMRKVRSNLRLLWGAALLVLVVGAANVAGLALARAHAQIPELATRIALGATGGDVIRRSLIDGILPALLSAPAGIVLGLWGLRFFDHELLPGAAGIAASPTVIVYALIGALVMGAFAGTIALVPLWKLELAWGMRTSSRGTTIKSAWLRSAFVVAQTALAFALLNGAAVLTATMRELLRVDPGFRVEDVWAASTFLPEATHPGNGLRLELERIAQAVRNVSGVEAAGGGSSVPFSGTFDYNVVLAEGYAMKPGESAIAPVSMRVSQGYLEALGIVALKGRLFDARDTNDAPRVIIVDERLARRFWPDQDPVGRKIYFNQTGSRYTVVGMVRSVRLEDLSGAGSPNGAYYIPWTQAPPSRLLNIIWRGPKPMVSAMQAEFARLAPGSTLFDLRPLAERREISLSARRTARTLVMMFAGVAVLLTALGINGLLAFLVAQRHREIGIRLAIGSRPADVFRMFLRQGATLTAVGLLLGLSLAVGLKPLIAGQLYGVSALEPWVLAIVATLIASVSLIATSLPSIRASRVDPIKALHET